METYPPVPKYMRYRMHRSRVDGACDVCRLERAGTLAGFSGPNRVERRGMLAYRCVSAFKVEQASMGRAPLLASDASLATGTIEEDR